MGGFVPDINVAGIFDQLNLRFGPGEAIKEMVALQREFGVFSEQHTLRQSMALLNVGPSNHWPHRSGWYKFLDGLKKYPSDRKGQSGHDRLMTALRDHLAAGQAAPVHFTCHDANNDQRLKVTAAGRKRALAYSTQDYMIVSLPLTPVEKNRMKRRAARR